jgi:hypothetical protein
MYLLYSLFESEMTPNDIVRSIAMLEWAWYNVENLSWDDDLCALVAQQGDQSKLDYVVGRASWGTKTLTAAARIGNMEMLMNFRLHTGEDCPWREETCAAAAGGGHLEVLKYLRRRPRGGGDVAPGGDVCSWDEYTCTAAAVNGHIEILKWSRKHGCPWSTETSRGASEYGNTQILEWMENQVPPCPIAIDNGEPFVDSERDSLSDALSYATRLVHARDGASCIPITPLDVELNETDDGDSEEEEWSSVSSFHSSEYGDIDDEWHKKYDNRA